MRTLAARHGISDVGLAKICKRIRVPRPGRGYWAKLAAGHKVKRTPLPALPVLPAGAQPSTDVTFTPRPEPSPPVPATPLPEVVANQQRHEALPENRISVPTRLTTRRVEILEAVRQLRDQRGVDQGLRHAGGPGAVDLRVGRDSIDRAARVMVAVLDAVEARGWRVRCAREYGDHTKITVLGEDVTVCISEKTKRVERTRPTTLKAGEYWSEYPRYNYVPTGQLALRIVEPYVGGIPRDTWLDGKEQRIEDCLNEFMVGLVAAAEAMRELRQFQRERERQWAEEARRRQEAERVRQEEAAKLRDLERQAADFARAREVRALADEVEATAVRARGGVEPGSELEGWLRWARHQADKLDPIPQLVRR
jgi:hypothetical protein